MQVKFNKKYRAFSEGSIIEMNDRRAKLFIKVGICSEVKEEIESKKKKVTK